jgi:hypothetical protein
MNNDFFNGTSARTAAEAPYCRRLRGLPLTLQWSLHAAERAIKKGSLMLAVPPA